MVARDQEQAFEPDVERVAERLEEACCFGVFVRFSRLHRVTSEEDEVEAALLLAQGFQISPPRVAEYTPTAPRLLFVCALRMEVRNMQKLQAILPVCHGSHTV